MRIYVTEPAEIDTDALALLASKGHDVIIEKEKAEARANEIDVLFVRTYTTVDVAMLDQFPKLSYILRAGVGLDTIDVAECKKRAIKVINAPGANANAVAEYVIGSAIFALRKFGIQEKSLAHGTWRLKESMGSELSGKVLGLIGCGNVGRMISRKLAAFGMSSIIGYDPFLSKEDLAAAGIVKAELEEVIAGGDILSLHVPLLPETKHLINRDTLAKMKKGALLINAARGGVVDEGALVAALKSGHLGGAVLDVYETEPDVSKELLALTNENVLLTPHIAGYTYEADKAIAMLPVEILFKEVERK